MELEHSFTVPVSKERAWDVLLDVERVAPCMPGATLDSVDGDEIAGKIKVKVGPISMTYTGTAKFVERDKDAGVVTLEASGKETRGSGTASASVRSVLEDRGAETHVTVHTTLNVTGKPAQFGRGVMNEVSGKLIGIFATNLADMISRANDGVSSPGPAAAEAPAGPGAAEAGPAGPGAAEAGPGAAEAAPVADAVPAGAAAAGAAGAAGAAASPALDDLGLSARTLASLHADGITTVEQLAAKSEGELLALDGIGPASVSEIKAKLAEVSQPQSAPAAATASSAASSGSSTTTVGSDKVSANGARTGATATAPQPTAQPSGDDSLNLLKVAGMPVLKRSIPVIAGVTAVLIISWRRKSKRRHK